MKRDRDASDRDDDVIVVRSKYFGGARSPRERADDVDVSERSKSWRDATSVAAHDTLDACVHHGSDALENFLTVAKIKNAHAAHEDAAHGVLEHFRRLRRLLVTETRTPTNADAERDDRDAFDDPAVKMESKKSKDEEAAEAARVETLGRAGDVLQNMLRETHRLHVNASCRVNTRAPEVKVARDNLTAIRREARELYRVIDPDGYAMDRERVRMMAEETQAAMDAKITRFDRPPENLVELRGKCPVMASTGSPHHLCAHLCYYREYEPARQMYVLRCRAAEADGHARALDGWRAELAVRPAEDIPSVNRSRADARGTASGACSLKHLPWMVEFIAPNGARYKDGMDVLNAVNVACDKLSWPRASHGGNGVREARVSEDGLNDQTELLRAALWDEDTDGKSGTTPVRRSFSRIAGGVDETRTPLRLAPDPLANDDETPRDDDDPRGIVVTAESAPNDETPARAPASPPSSPGSGPEPVRHWWAPPLSPFGLLEEILWQDEWKLLVSCMMLNCSSKLLTWRLRWRHSQVRRKSYRRQMPKEIRRQPTLRRRMKS